MLKLCRVTKVKVLFLVLVNVFNFNLFEFSAAILEKGLFVLYGMVLTFSANLLEKPIKITSLLRNTTHMHNIVSGAGKISVLSRSGPGASSIVTVIFVPKRVRFTRQEKNGTDPLKSGTVPISFVKKYPCSTNEASKGIKQ